ncbi:tyrosine-type recombinase/integrase [Enterococcus nangangensis]
MSENIDLTEVIQELELSDTARGLTEGTIKKNRKFLSMFSNHCYTLYGIRSISEVKALHIKSFLASKLQAGCSESYVNVHLRCIRALFIYCEQEGYMNQAENPCLRVKWAKEPQPVVRTWTAADMKVILAHCQQLERLARAKVKNQRGLYRLYAAMRDSLALMTLADTGLRLFELVALQNDDVTPSGIHVRKGKGKKARMVYCSPLVYKQLLKFNRAKQAYFSSRGIKPTEFIFCDKHGQQWDKEVLDRRIKAITAPLLIDHTVRASAHTFRHYFAQQQLKNGCDLFTLQRLLGHSRLSTTQVYLNSMADDTVNARGLLSSPLMNLNKERK